MTRTNYAIVAVMTAGCILALTGPALPMIEYDFGFIKKSLSGYSPGREHAGFEDFVGGSVLCSGVATALFVLTIFTRRWHLLVKVGLILFSALGTSLGILLALAVMFGPPEDAYYDASVGAGLWMTIWGGIGILAASIWGSVKWNATIGSAG